MGVIVGLFVVLLVIGLLVACFQLFLRVAKYAAALAAGVYLAPGLLLGFASFNVLKRMRGTWLAQPALAIVASFLALVSAALGEFLWAGAYGLSAVLAIGGASNRWRARKVIAKIGWRAAAKPILAKLDAPNHIGIWLLITAFIARQGTAQLGPTVHTWMGWGYWVAAVAAQLYATIRFIDFRRAVHELERQTASHKGTAVAALATSCKKAAVFLDNEIDTLVSLHIASHVLDDQLVEFDLGGRRTLYTSHWYRAQVNVLQRVLAQKDRFTDEELGRLTKMYLGLEFKDGLELLTHHINAGARYQLEDGYYFVSFSASYQVEACASCGMGRHVLKPNETKGEWFCSDVCITTEKTCLDIHRQTPESFIADSVSIGMTLVSASDSWVRNHKVFAAGSQGHGIGAEHANTYVDRILGRRAENVGADNVRNGADRLVNGMPIQTKYCKTAARSVGSAFEGQNGSYRYMRDGKPMTLEVPRDQYEKALETMRKKIAEGNVPGISDPDEAVNIVKKGHLTYENARNLAKFGTFESVGYDAAEGAISGFGAASISFCITSGLVYVRTGDSNVAVQAAALQAGRSGLTTAASYVATQQLHRIEVVQAALSHIDVSCLSPTVREVLKKGMGASNNKALNHALRGSVVTAVVSVAITSAPDVYRLVRREVTAAKLKRTVATAGGGVAGGFVGSVAGGAIGSVGGPLCAWAGKLIGGTVGAMAGTSLVDYFFAEQKERERETANQLFRAHLEYLAISFALSEEELRCVVRNFLRLSSENMHQRVLAGMNKGRPYLNSVLKPLVVGVVKQRDHLQLPTPEPILQLSAA